MKPKIYRIPKKWKIIKLEDVILNIGDGGTPPTRIKEYFGGNIPWVNIEDIKKDIYNTKRYLTELGLKNSSAKLWPEETIIFSFGASIGKVGIARVKLCTKQGIAGIVPNKDKVLPEFLYYVLVKEASKIKKIGESMGSTIKEVRPSKLVKLVIFLLPTISEQKTIVEILSTVDQVIQKVDEIITKTERLKKGLMQRLFTKGIGHKEFKDTEIGRIPKSWKIEKLRDIVIYIKGRKPDRLKKEYKCGYIPYLTTEYFRTGRNEQFVNLGEDKNVVTVDKNDVVLIWDGSNAGDVFIGVEGVLASTMVKILPIKNNLSKLYLYFFLKTRFKILKSQTTGSTIPHVNKIVFENLKIPLPPLPEQQKITEILLTIDKKLELERKRKEKLERIKKGLMNDLLTGKRRVKIK